MPPTFARKAPASQRIWPITALLVLLAAVLMAYQYFGAAIMTASFFGDTPSRNDYITAAMACLTTVPAFAAMIWCGAQRGCQLGLWLIAAAAGLMIYLGVSILPSAGDPRDPDPGRSVNLTDVFGASAGLNWVIAALFVGVAVTTRRQRRLRRHTRWAFDA